MNSNYIGKSSCGNNESEPSLYDRDTSRPTFIFENEMQGFRRMVAGYDPYLDCVIQTNVDVSLSGLTPAHRHTPPTRHLADCRVHPTQPRESSAVCRPSDVTWRVWRYPDGALGSEIEQRDVYLLTRKYGYRPRGVGGTTSGFGGNEARQISGVGCYHWWVVSETSVSVSSDNWNTRGSRYKEVSK